MSFTANPRTFQKKKIEPKTEYMNHDNIVGVTVILMPTYP